jgi:hypothetical protein
MGGDDLNIVPIKRDKLQMVHDPAFVLALIER